MVSYRKHISRSGIKIYDDFDKAKWDQHTSLLLYQTLASWCSKPGNKNDSSSARTTVIAFISEISLQKAGAGWLATANA